MGCLISRQLYTKGYRQVHSLPRTSTITTPKNTWSLSASRTTNDASNRDILLSLEHTARAMRPGAEYPMAHVPAASSAAAPRSPWQSPVPYLFGGLAAMLGLIALSLLALACSYWNLSGGALAGLGDADQADGEKRSAAGPAGECQGHVVVIMAGDERPTFLATPASTVRPDAEDGVGPAADATACCAACRSEERNLAGARGAGTRPDGYEDDAQSQRRREDCLIPHNKNFTEKINFKS
uniref:Uncharacterized protein n=1 Tax=Avena sativa TaxID=4498 RepID=A0ACD5Z7W6_AVESA